MYATDRRQTKASLNGTEQNYEASNTLALSHIWPPEAPSQQTATAIILFLCSLRIGRLRQSVRLQHPDAL